MNPCKCGGEIYLDYQQGYFTAQYWYAICNECGTEYPLKSNNRIDAEREWNNRKEGQTMNLISKICELLGVEIGEEFKVENDVCLHRFTENGLEYKVCGVWSACARLNLVLNGTEKIIKLPFEPKRNEKYFVVSVVDKSVMPYIWDGHTADYCFKACGNCFRTKAEAEKHKYEIYEKLTGKKWEEKCDS